MPPVFFDTDQSHNTAGCAEISAHVESLKNMNFKNPRWQLAAISKTVKSPYLHNCFTDFDKI